MALGTPIAVLGLAIEQLAVARDALQRIQDGEDMHDLTTVESTR